MALISAQNLSLAFGGRPLLDGVSLRIQRGERIGLLGRNGEGKSSLLHLLVGARPPDAGEVLLASGVNVALMEQQTPSNESRLVGELVGERLSRPEHGDHPVERVCSLLRLDPAASFHTLSGGQQRRVLLGRALVAEPDVLLLDEPTNHLDIESIVWLESFLARFAGSLLFVSHDRAFLRRLATRILELDRGRLRSWTCGYETFLERKEAELAAEEKAWARRDKKLAQEEDWIRQGIKARRTRNEGRVRALERLRAERAARRTRSGEVRLSIQTAERSGTKVVAAKGVGFGYTGQPSLLRDFAVTIRRGDKIGIIGPNGCGKTTLLHVLLGMTPPRSGTVKHGTTLEVGYFDQHRHELDGERTVQDSVADGREYVMIDGGRKHILGYLQDFLFSPDRARQPVSSLSGGERNRLLLARLFVRPSNVLVLDEPTNDLDAETLELLEARLVDYPGTVLVVSHDREFLDNLCTATLVFEGGGTVREYPGGYSDWQRVRQAATASAPPDPTPRPVPAPRAGNPAAPRPRKLSNREREEYAALPRRIEQLEAELEALHQQMADPAFFRKESDAIKQVTERLQSLAHEIEAAFTRWAELERRA
jgi:ABC transport system ATP-binding/permease protein